MINKLIYGKAGIQRIVSLEVIDSFVELFIQDEQGNITTEVKPNKYWLLAHDKLDGNFIRLKGNLYYCWGRQFDDREEFVKFRAIYKKRDVYSIYNAKEAIMVKDGYTYYQGLQPKDVSILSFDLETTSLSPDDDKAKILIISTTFRHNGQIRKKMFCYDDYETQGELLIKFCEYVCHLDPSIIIGHNILGFDLPYLQGIADQEGIELKLGRNGSSIKFDGYESKFRKEGAQFIYYKSCKIYGREVVDTLFLSIRHDVTKRQYMSYGLKNIIKQEGLEKIGRVFYDANVIRHNYMIKEEWDKIKQYCEDDSDDALSLFDLMVPAFFYMANSIAKSFQSIMETASGSQLNSILVRSYLQDAHSIPKTYDTNEYVEGGISFGVPGIYKNVIKSDIKSAYPSQILRFKMYDENKDPEGNFFKMVEFFTNQRFELKELARNDETGYHKARDNSAKTFINSAYGLLNTPGLNFNAPHLAAKITLETRNVIELALQWASGNGVEYWRNKSVADS